MKRLNDKESAEAKLRKAYLEAHPRACLGDDKARDSAPEFTSWEEPLEKALCDLTDRQRRVIELRFGLADGRPHTLADVAREFALTRERIHQIEAKALRKLSLPRYKELAVTLTGSHASNIPGLLREMTQVFSTRQAADYLQCTTSELRGLVADGQVNPVKTSSGRLLFYANDLKRIKIPPPKSCIICGQPLPRRRRLYCSTECFKERWSYRNWSDERKARHRDKTKKWHEEHPEQATIINKRASSNYQRKLAKLRSFEKIASDIASWE